MKLNPYFLWLVVYAAVFGGSLALAADFYRQHTRAQLPSGHIELRVSKTRYQPAETIGFTVVNHFPTTIYVNNQCPQEPLNVYRWQDNRWVQLHAVASSEKSECYAEERRVAIAPDDSRSYNFNDWPDLFKEPGVYRIAMVVDHYRDVPFQDFVVLEPAPVIKIQTSNKAVQVVVPAPPPTSIEPAPLPRAQVREDDDPEREDSEDEEEGDDD